ncbi:MAG TPA: DUF6328 family protein, partial [Gaiellaceae bacterium]|nr:DUF6328 family protein [Gaiellaceae bacterium]
ATALLIAPSANHRILFRQRDKERLLKRSNVQSIVGLVFLALSVVGAVALITDVIFDSLAATLTAAGVAVVFALLWFVMPVYRRLTTPGGEASI